VTSTVRASLLKNKLVILPIHQEHSRQDESVTDKYGNQKTNRVTTVNTVYRIVNTENPEEYIDVASSGTGVDTQDKGVGKAMTYAYKYMLLRTFAIPTGEDTDKVSSDLYDAALYGGKAGEDRKKPAKEKRGADKKAADSLNADFDRQMGAPATPEQIRKIQEACFALNYGESKILEAFHVTSLDGLTQKAAENAIKRLNAKADGAA
jgi:hypothetical protein